MTTLIINLFDCPQEPEVFAEIVFGLMRDGFGIQPFVIEKDTFYDADINTTTCIFSIVCDDTTKEIMQTHSNKVADMLNGMELLYTSVFLISRKGLTCHNGSNFKFAENTTIAAAINQVVVPHLRLVINNPQPEIPS